MSEVLPRNAGSPPSINNLKVKIYSDGADIDSILEAQRSGIVKGFTTNPTLMARSGVVHYLNFAQEVLSRVKALPVSFEVFSDDLGGMKEQALVLADLADNVYVKIPVTNTRRESTASVVRELSARGVKLNVTAIFSLRQVKEVVDALATNTPAVVSIFAGRIADTGMDPLPLMKEAQAVIKAKRPLAELLWASPREVFNIIQADQMGCDIITVTPELLGKAGNLGRELEDFSLDTVKMFYQDACKSGFTIEKERTMT
ncbi:MAG: transaldolase [Spartobacteria bacterium]|nr:transaldolase [Spartobacteria bacterium]